MVNDRKVILFVVNSISFFLSHRLEIALASKNCGFDVHVAAPYDEDNCKLLYNLGFSFHTVSFSRYGLSPFNECISVFSLVRLFLKLKPDLVHLITIKPYLYGGIAARVTGVKCVVSAVAGLGIVFSSSEYKYRLLRSLLFYFFKFSFGHPNQVVIFQNSHDRDLLLNLGVISQDKVRMIRGSGVDLSKYKFSPDPVGTPIVTFASRLLKDKGVEVFVESSRILTKRGVDVKFWLIGEPDSGSSNSVSYDQLDEWRSERLIEVFGFRSDVPELFSKSSIIVFPSYYGEGLPKVLIEAAACGRPVVTTNHPGCIDAIIPNETGFLIPIKDPVALADMIQRLIEFPLLRIKMGAAGRALAESSFSIDLIVKMHMDIYQDILEL